MKIDFIAFLLQVLNFSIFAGALWYLLSKPVKKMLAERSDKIAEGQKAADKALANAAESEKLRDKILKEARGEAKKEMDAMKEEIADKQVALMKEAREDAKVEKDKMVKVFAQEQKNQIDALRSEFMAAVVATAGAVSGAAIDAKQHAALIDKGLEQIARS